MVAGRPKNVRENMRLYRERMRAQGLRPVQFWVPDVRSPGVAQELRRQSLALVDDKAEREILDWIEHAADTRDWV